MSLPRPFRIAAAIAFAGLWLLPAVGCGASERSAAEETPSAELAGAPAGEGTVLDFTLHDAWGKPLSLADQRGRVVLLTFLYTQCRDVCPLIAQNLNTVLGRLGAERSDVRVIAVSVDPRRDTPTAVKEYIHRHKLLPEFVYLSGAPLELQQVWQNYNVLALERNLDVIDHDAPTLLVDRSGRARAVYVSGVSVQDVLHDVRLVLAEDGYEPEP